jgi:hypothetical protein
MMEVENELKDAMKKPTVSPHYIEIMRLRVLNLRNLADLKDSDPKKDTPIMGHGDH